jgi:carbonic anhydrase
MLYNDYTVTYNAYLPPLFTPQSMNINSTVNYGYLGLEINGLINEYELKNITFSYPADHQIEGQQADLEVKFIHKKMLSFQTTVNQFRKIPDAAQYLIVSILYKSTSQIYDDGFLSDFLENWDGSGVITNKGIQLNSYGLMRDRQYYFYEGSFTTDPCDEIVNYIVIKDFFNINSTLLTPITTYFNNFFTNGGFTNKGVANYYGRNVTRNYMVIGELSGSLLRTNILLLAFILLLFILI